MGFKKKSKTTSVPESPDKLFLELPRRKIPDVLPHQREIMRSYQTDGVDKSDVALQLPTGSGKTLVGLLIAEWRRRKFNERVVYLCPTKQLVNQTVEQGEEKYGLTAHPFTGRIRDYDPTARAEYRNADSVAITTYSSLFNTNPFFSDADIVIVDDAHASENYIANMWSLRVERFNEDHTALHKALAVVLKPKIGSANFSRLTQEYSSPSDRAWIDKLPTPDLYELSEELIAVFDAHADSANLQYSWSMLKENLLGCQLYLSAKDILLRPLIPPTWTHAPFASPKQRIFMSATLGAGGDLERLTGRDDIVRLQIPEGWERQGVGRRFFIFPGMSIKQDKIDKFRLQLMQEAGRSLVLAPNQIICDTITDQVDTHLQFNIFSAEDIEISKKPFVDEDDAVAIIANRYDGIDFPGDECRLLIVEGFPRVTNLQESFIMTRMGANILFNERIQTRVFQAIGRCTRSLEDYSTVVVIGEELQDYLADIKKRDYMHPELQAEISFGVEQSKGTKFDEIVENFQIFIENGKDWEEVNNEIVTMRETAERKSFPAIDELHEAVRYEINYQTALWSGDYAAALDAAESVLASLKEPNLKGYRALWHYLSGSTAWLGWKTGITSLESKSRNHFDFAKNATKTIPWLYSLAHFNLENSTETDKHNVELYTQIEQVESVLSKLGVVHDAAYSRHEKQIFEGLDSKDKGLFEEAHKYLGELLGFRTGNEESDGSPDPWWISRNVCLVFEDHQGAESSSALNTTKARQASNHPNWIMQNVEEAKDLEIIPVLVSPVKKVSSGAKPHISNLMFWPLDEFKAWSVKSLAILRELRSTFSEAGDMAWRAEAAKKFDDNCMSASAITKLLKDNPAEKHLILP